MTAAAANAITADEIISLVYALKSPYRKNAKFLMNDATVSLLRKLKDGNGAYLWQPSVQAGQPDKLLGYDIYTSPYAPAVAAGAFAIAFGDFKNYWIGGRAGRTVQRLSELYATNGQVGFVATERVDGKVILPEGIQLLKILEDNPAFQYVGRISVNEWKSDPKYFLITINYNLDPFKRSIISITGRGTIQVNRPSWF